MAEPQEIVKHEGNLSEVILYCTMLQSPRKEILQIKWMLGNFCQEQLSLAIQKFTWRRNSISILGIQKCFYISWTQLRVLTEDDCKDCDRYRGFFKKYVSVNVRSLKLGENLYRYIRYMKVFLTKFQKEPVLRESYTRSHVTEIWLQVIF